MSTTSYIVQSPRRVLAGAAQLAALLALAPALGAQDTTAVTRTPAAAAPASVVRKDTTIATAAAASSATAAKDSALARPAAAAPAVTAAPATTRPAAPAPSTAPTVTPAGAPAGVPSGIDGIPQSDLANEYVQRAVSLYELGRDEEALAEYRRGIAHDPLDSDTWYGLADLLHEMGRDKQAIETYTLALTTIEHAPELRLPFAELLMANKRKPEAIKVLQRGIELDPEHSDDLKAMLGKVVLGVLDDSASVAAAPAVAAATPVPATAPSAKAATPTTKAKARPERKKRKKLCNLFCPGTLDTVAPKP